MRTINNLPPVPDRKHIEDFRQLVISNAEAYGDKALYVYVEDGEEITVSYNDFYNLVLSFSTGLSSLGLAGKTVAITGDTHPYWLAAFYSVIIMGGVAVPLDHDLDASELSDFMKIAGCNAIVYTASMNEKIASIESSLDFVDYFIPVSADKTGEKIKPFCDVLVDGKNAYDGGNTCFADVEIDLDKLAVILFTSGTTGTSKGVMLSQGNLCASANASSLATQYGPDDRFVSVLPVHHTYELTTGHIALSNLGCTAYICESVRYAQRYFKKYNPTGLLLVPLFLETMHKKIWQEIRKKGIEKKVKSAIRFSDSLLAVGIDNRNKLFGEITAAFGDSLKSIVVGGAPIDENIVKDFYSFGISVFQGYGITECAPLVSVNRPGHVKFDSVGQVVDFCEVKIEPLEDAEDGDGEILVRGDNVMLGYFNDPEATKEAFTEDGWFRTGDIGTLDKKGYVKITGRLKNVIIASNGKNVFPEELEDRLNVIPSVKECVVLSRENEEGEAEIVAVIVPDYEVVGEGTSDAAISFILKEAIAQVNKGLPAYKHIDRFEIRHTDFEKTLTKKIKRFLVK